MTGVPTTAHVSAEAELDTFVSGVLSRKTRSFKMIASPVDDAHHRRDFNDLWTDYVRLFEAIEGMQRSMAAVRIEQNEATFRELAAVEEFALQLMEDIEERFDKCCEALRKVHSEIKQLKSQIEEYAAGR